MTSLNILKMKSNSWIDNNDDETDVNINTAQGTTSLPFTYSFSYLFTLTFHDVWKGQKSLSDQSWWLPAYQVIMYLSLDSAQNGVGLFFLLSRAYFHRRKVEGEVQTSELSPDFCWSELIEPSSNHMVTWLTWERQRFYYFCLFRLFPLLSLYLFRKTISRD